MPRPVDESAALWYVAPELATTHDRLVAWGRWSRDRALGHNHCASIEHRYVAPSLWDDERRRPTSSVNIREAVETFDVVCRLPYRNRYLLHMWYVHRSPVGFIQRKLKLRYQQMAAELYQSRFFAAQRLGLLEQESIKPQRHG